MKAKHLNQFFCLLLTGVMVLFGTQSIASAELRLRESKEEVDSSRMLMEWGEENHSIDNHELDSSEKTLSDIKEVQELITKYGSDIVMSGDMTPCDPVQFGNEIIHFIVDPETGEVVGAYGESIFGGEITFQASFENGLVSSLTFYRPDGSIDSVFNLAYDSQGNLTEVWSYDAYGTLLSVLNLDPDTGVPVSITTYLPDGSVSSYQYFTVNANNEIISIDTYDQPGGVLLSTVNMDPSTGMPLDKTCYHPDGSIAAYHVYTVNAFGEIVSVDTFDQPGGVLRSTVIIDPSTGLPLNKITFALDGVTVESYQEFIYNANNELVSIATYDYQGGALLSTLNIDPSTGALIDLTTYASDGSIESYHVYTINANNQIVSIDVYDQPGGMLLCTVNIDPLTGMPINKTKFRADGSIESYHVYTINANNQIVSIDSYDYPGGTLESVTTFDPSTGQVISVIHYQPDGTVRLIIMYNYNLQGEVASIDHHDPDTMNLIRRVYLNEEGQVDYVINYGWNGEIKNIVRYHYVDGVLVQATTHIKGQKYPIGGVYFGPQGKPYGWWGKNAYEHIELIGFINTCDVEVPETSALPCGEDMQSLTMMNPGLIDFLNENAC